MDYYTIDEINEQLEIFLEQAKIIWNLYDNLKKYELMNNSSLYEKTITQLRLEIINENELYNNTDYTLKTVISEYLNNYVFECSDDSILESQLNLSVKDAIVERIKTRLVNSVINKYRSDYETFKYNNDDNDVNSIIENCSKNYYTKDENIDELNTMEFLVNEYSRNYFNILCSQIDNINDLNVKKMLINHKYNLLYCNDFMESKILLSDNQLLNFFSVNINTESKEMLSKQKNNLFNKFFEIDLEKMIELSNEKQGTYSFNSKKVLTYASIRSNIEVLNDILPINIINAYADEVMNNSKIKNKKAILSVLNNLITNLDSDYTNLNSIRIRKIKK